MPAEADEADECMAIENLLEECASHAGDHEGERVESRSPWHGGRYRYTKDLLALQACRKAEREKLPPALEGRVSPLNAEEWRKALTTIPDREFAEYLIGGIGEGFKIGFQYSDHQPQSVLQNMPSAGKNKQTNHPIRRAVPEEGVHRGQSRRPLRGRKQQGHHR